MERLVVFMFLTDEQKFMLEGKMGYPAQLGMEINVALGEAFDAEKMVRITGAHLGGISIRSAESAIMRFVHELADKGGKFKVFTTTNIICGDLNQWDKLGMLPDDRIQQEGMMEAITRMGATIMNTCTPYNLGHVPRFGEHVAWMESSAIIYLNSVLGACTNREGQPSAIAAALTGCVPEYGFHLKENRHGSIVINVTCPLKETFDFSTLGYFAGRDAARKGIVVFAGIDWATNDDLKHLGAAMATSGCTAMYHIVGVTPEAPTLEAALNSTAPELELEYGEKEKKETEEFLNRDKTTNLDWIQIGCPHASIQELEQVAAALKGKKVNPKISMWINTPQPIIMMAERLGYADTITEAGAILVADTCPINMTIPYLQKTGFHSVATNSAKQCFYIPGMCCGMTTHYGNIEKLVDAAVNGEWR